METERWTFWLAGRWEGRQPGCRQAGRQMRTSRDDQTDRKTHRDRQMDTWTLDRWTLGRWKDGQTDRCHDTI